MPSVSRKQAKLMRVPDLEDITGNPGHRGINPNAPDWLMHPPAPPEAPPEEPPPEE